MHFYQKEMVNANNKIINGFCYIKEESVIFIDLVTEVSKIYDIKLFNKFLKDHSIDEFCIILSNRENEDVTPLYKYKMSSSKTKQYIRASDQTKNSLIDLCYKVCIEMFKKS